jgi:hypothetical protein
MEYRPVLFVAEEIQVQLGDGPALEKKPECPSGFMWRGEAFQVLEVLKEWHDYARRGRMSRNMAPRHLATAALRGSWGVGRDYYRVRTHTGRVFDLYYDRAPNASGGRRGSWFLYRELALIPDAQRIG